MRNLKFCSARASNILCFGPDGVELKFNKYSNVVVVKGANYDNPGNNDDDRSNASGKSSLPEILSIGLYGRTIKKTTKLNGSRIINVLADKGEVEVVWDDYRVLRSFKRTPSGASSKIKIWESKDHIWNKDTEITLISSESQKWIEDKLGFTHHAFCSIVIFEDSDKYQFLEMDGVKKREFIENLLGLDVFRDYHKNAKILLKKLKDSIDITSMEYNSLKNDIDACDRRISNVLNQENDWKIRLQNESKQLLVRVEAKQNLLTNSDTGKLLDHWQKAQERISQLNLEIQDIEDKRTKFSKVVNDAREKLESTRIHRDAINGSIQDNFRALKESQEILQKHLNLINELESLQEGAKCPTCHGKISKNNYRLVLNHSTKEVETQKTTSEQYKRIVNSKKEEFGDKASKASMMELKIKEAEDKYAVLAKSINAKRSEISELTKLSKPDGNSEERVLESEISELKKQINSKQEEFKNSPYKEIIEQSIQEKTQKEIDVKNKSLEMGSLEKEIPYLQYWVNAFAEKGIRKYVVDGIIPALNSRITYWLQILIDGKIELKFDNELEEIVTRNGNDASYHGGSKSECRRVNLAVSQAFSYVMMLNSGSCPNLVFLDEITGGSIDRSGVVGVYNMIFELAKERQVFVTTHDEILISMLDGCEVIKLEKRNDISRLAS